MLPLFLAVRVFAPVLRLALPVWSELVVRAAHSARVVPAWTPVPPPVLYRDQERVVVRPLHAWMVWLFRLLRPLPVAATAVLPLVLLVVVRVGPP